jgi:hypothetical protein
MRDLVHHIEKLIQHDMGNRGIKHFASLANGNLFRTCQHLFHECKHVAVCTGFNVPPPENDGPLGAMWIIDACLKLGKRVTLISDVGNGPVMEHLRNRYLETNVSRHKVKNLFHLVLFPDRALQTEQEALQFADGIIGQQVPHIDHIISIERVGPADDSLCYNMRAKDISHLNGRVESMFYIAKEKAIFTTGIGDGGNEIGMANVKEQVRKFILNGDKIACSIGCDSLIINGVSNWSGYAICAILQLMKLSCETQNQSHPDSWWLSVQTDRSWLKYLTEELKVVDGIKGIPDMSVDGLSYDQVHGPLIEKILSICSEYINANSKKENP